MSTETGLFSPLSTIPVSQFPCAVKYSVLAELKRYECCSNLLG
jgi:hypothetical protein